MAEGKNAGIKNHVGQIINNISIIKRFTKNYLFSRTENRYKPIDKYLCKCLSCLTEFEKSKLTVHKKLLNCATCNGRTENAAKNLIYYEYKNGAKNRNLEFSADELYFKNLLTKNCFYCNIEPKTTSLYLKTFKYNGIDRFDNTLGYTQNNIRSCCIDCNKAKWTMNFDEFKVLYRSIFINYILLQT